MAEYLRRVEAKSPKALVLLLEKDGGEMRNSK